MGEVSRLMCLEGYGVVTEVWWLFRCEPSQYEQPATPYSVSKAVRMSHTTRCLRYACLL